MPKKPNYSFEKHLKEQARAKKKEAKAGERERKQAERVNRREDAQSTDATPDSNGSTE